MNINKIIHIIEKTDIFYNNKQKLKFSSKLLYWILIPAYYIFERIYYKKIWKNYVVKSLIENDNVFLWFENNGFEMKNNCFHLVDLLQSQEIDEKLRADIRQNWIDKFLMILNKNINFDIENYISLVCKIDLKFIEQNGEMFKHPIYDINIQSCRYEILNICHKRFIKWVLLLIIILSIITVLIKFAF